jgi:hypothetical protein
LPPLTMLFGIFNPPSIPGKQFFLLFFIMICLFY